MPIGDMYSGNLAALTFNHPTAIQAMGNVRGGVIQLSEPMLQPVHFIESGPYLGTTNVWEAIDINLRMPDKSQIESYNSVIEGVQQQYVRFTLRSALIDGPIEGRAVEIVNEAMVKVADAFRCQLDTGSQMDRSTIDSQHEKIRHVEDQVIWFPVLVGITPDASGLQHLTGEEIRRRAHALP